MLPQPAIDLHYVVVQPEVIMKLLIQVQVMAFAVFPAHPVLQPFSGLPEVHQVVPHHARVPRPAVFLPRGRGVAPIPWEDLSVPTLRQRKD